MLPFFEPEKRKILWIFSIANSQLTMLNSKFPMFNTVNGKG